MEEIAALANKSQLFSYDPQSECCGLHDLDDRWVRLFKKMPDGKFIEIGIKEIVQEIADYLSRHVSIEKLLKDKLLHEPLETILKIHKKVKEKAVVKEHRGCYYLTIRGTGRPIDLELLEVR